MLVVTEIFKSIQGESTYAGLPFWFIRLTGCNLRCAYCDTTYAYEGGQPITVDQAVEPLAADPLRNVLITGGEPLMQQDTPALAQALLDRSFTVLVETNGSQDIAVLPRGVCRIVDFKCPSSGHENDNRLENIKLLTSKDEVKFVMSDRDDFDWAKDFLFRQAIASPIPILFSAVESALPLPQLASWILEDHLPVRLNVQLHRWIWPKSLRGV